MEKTCMDEILIDRLVLEVPGLTPAAAEQLAKKVGEGLANAASTGTAKPAQGGDFSHLTVNWEDHLDNLDGSNMPRLADAIVQAVMRQIG
jgi:hypothetical protein